MKRKWRATALAGLLAFAAGARAQTGSPDSLLHESGVWFGASVREAGADSSGLEITAVEPDGPAATAGLLAGDLVLRVDGIAVSERGDFVRHIQTRHPGDGLRVAIRRGGAPEQTVVVTLAARRDEAAGATWVDRLQGSLPSAAWLQGRPRLGVDVVELDADLAAYFRAPHPTGALVTRVEETGPGARGGLRTGDILLRVDGHDVRSTGALSAAIDVHADGDVVEIEVWRQQNRRTLRVPVESRVAWFGRTRTPAPQAAPAGAEELRREVQKLRREVEELRREVDMLRRRR